MVEMAFRVAAETIFIYIFIKNDTDDVINVKNLKYVISKMNNIISRNRYIS